MRKILVAAAWPYGNGSLHLGHVSALIGADVLARYHRLVGDDVLYVSGTDAHGTPIVVEADRLGIEPGKIAAKYHEEFSDNLINGLGFTYDLYTVTTTLNHEQIVQDFFTKLLEAGLIYPKTDDHLFCPKCKRFLPDRYVEGRCPKCNYDNARGDQCDNCGNLIDVKTLGDPHCKVCNGAPVWKSSEHFFLKLSSFTESLHDWVSSSSGWRPNASNFTLGLLKEGLPDRAITRDTLWGIPIPLKGFETKRIYVWFEAVIGYFSASIEWAKKSGDPEAWKKFWLEDDAIHYYVHGKDNIPFHTVIWPAMLMGYGGLHLPDKIVSSGYLTLEGQQFSKSRHWAVWLPDMLKHFDGDMIRYHMIINGPETSDADFSWQEFGSRINGELIATFGNFVNRVLPIVKKNYPDGLEFPTELSEEQDKFIDDARKTFKSVGAAIEKGHFRKALKTILELLDQGNRFVNDAAPWSAIKKDPEKAKKDLAVCVQVIRSLAVLVNPFLPNASKRIGAMLNVNDKTWAFPEPSKTVVGEVKPIYRKIDPVEITEQENLLGKN